MADRKRKSISRKHSLKKQVQPSEADDRGLASQQEMAQAGQENCGGTTAASRKGSCLDVPIDTVEDLDSSPTMPREEGAVSPVTDAQNIVDNAEDPQRRDRCRLPSMELTKQDYEEWKQITEREIDWETFTEVAAEISREMDDDEEADTSRTTEAVLKCLERSFEAKDRRQSLRSGRSSRQQSASGSSSANPQPELSSRRASHAGSGSKRSSISGKSDRRSSSPPDALPIPPSSSAADPSSFLSGASQGGARPKIPSPPPPEIDTLKMTLEEVQGDVKDTRQFLIDSYHKAMAQRAVLRKESLALQHKVAQHLRGNKRSSDERKDHHGKTASDNEHRYVRLMGSLEDDMSNYFAVKERYKQLVEASKRLSEARCQEADEQQLIFSNNKRAVAFGSMYMGTGKLMSQAMVDECIKADIKKDKEVSTIRLSNIKMKFSKFRLETVIKAKDELAKGLHLIDFEQLKLENQSLNEKTEERNEELRKVRRKISATVHVLTHLKEKIQFVEAEKGILLNSLQKVEIKVTKKREKLNKSKKKRDSLRIGNERLQKKNGLRCFKPLLEDYQEMKDLIVKLQKDLVDMQAHHAQLVLQTKKIRHKIRLAKAELEEEVTSLA